MVVRDEPGKGLKKCIACGKYVGARSLICEACNEPMAKKKVQVAPLPGGGRTSSGVVATTAPSSASKGGLSPGYTMRVWVPAGTCTVRPVDFSSDALVSWASSERAKLKPEWLTLDGLKFWLGTAIERYIRLHGDVVSNPEYDEAMEAFDSVVESGALKD